MKTLLYRRMEDEAGSSVELAIQVKPRLARPPIYVVSTLNDSRRDWDVRVEYTKGPELKWATRSPWRTLAPNLAKLAMASFTRDVQEYERMGYR